MFTLYQPEVHEETPAPELRMSLNQDEVSSSGILEIMDEVFKELHKEQVEGPLPTDTYRPLLEREVYEKAVITLFQEQMPWTLPDPPTDPQSLRKTCQEEGSPFFIVSLSKRDRRNLKTR